MLIVLIAILLKRLFLSIKKVAIATTATELITSQMKFSWRIKRRRETTYASVRLLRAPIISLTETLANI